MTDLELIEKLGGGAAVARLINVKPPSIVYWKKKGIPKLRMIQLKSLRPDVFNEAATVQPTATPTGN
jgi:hypothetical protein